MAAVLKTAGPEMVPWVRIPPAPPLWNISANAVRRRSYAICRSQNLQKLVARAHDPNLALGDLDPLGQRPQMIPPKSAVLSTHAPTGDGRKAGDLLGRDRLSRTLDRGACAFRVDARLIARRLQFLDPRPERRIVEISDAALNGVVKALQSRLCGGGAVDQFRGMRAPAFVPLLAPVEMDREQVSQPLGLEEPLLQMLGHQMVEPVHLHRAALAASLALPRGGRAGVVAIVLGLARGAQRHRAAAVSAEADTGEQRRPADGSARHDHGAARLEQVLDRVEGFPVDQRRHGHGDGFRLRLRRAVLVVPAPLMLADVGAARQDAVHRADAPATAGAGIELARVEILGDRLHAHAPARAVAFECQLEH